MVGTPSAGAPARTGWRSAGRTWTSASGLAARLEPWKNGFNGAYLIQGASWLVEFTGIESVDIESGSGNDDLFTFEGNDRVVTGAGNDVINTNGGNDTLIGGTGDDALNGGDGTDLADWSTATGDLTFLLAADGAGTFDNAGTGRDTFTGIEGVRAGRRQRQDRRQRPRQRARRQRRQRRPHGDGVLMLTTEAQSIRRLYIATLDRGPDAAGWTDWTTQREGGLRSTRSPPGL